MKKRIISAAVMLAIAIPAIILGGKYFKVFTGIIAILVYREILNLKGIKKYPIPIVILGLASIMFLTISKSGVAFNVIGLDFKRIAAVLILMFTPVIYYFNKNKYSIDDAFFLTMFIMFIGISLNLFTNILVYSKAYFWLIFIVTIATDTFAYFTGMFLGKKKITKISPKKTLEGCIGGLVMGSAVASIYYLTFIGARPFYIVIPVIMVMSVFCQLGDLFFSVIKRENNIKDFSNLIPGHGGVLDRLDSLIFVMLIYVIVSGII